MSDDRHRPPGRARPSRDDEETRKVKTSGGDSLTAAQAEANTAPAYTIHTSRETRLEEIRVELGPRPDEMAPEDYEGDVWSQYADELEAAIEWQRADNLTQLRIFAEERDAAKHENRELRGKLAEIERSGVGSGKS